jgi:hypothetical protein
MKAPALPKGISSDFCGSPFLKRGSFDERTQI